MEGEIQDSSLKCKQAGSRERKRLQRRASPFMAGSAGEAEKTGLHPVGGGSL